MLPDWCAAKYENVNNKRGPYYGTIYANEIYVYRKQLCQFYKDTQKWRTTHPAHLNVAEGKEKERGVRGDIKIKE